MRAIVNSVGNANFVNVPVVDMKKAVASAESTGDNEISIPLFIRSGKGAEGLHSAQGIAEALGKDRVYIVSGDVATRTYVPKNGTKVVE